MARFDAFSPDFDHPFINSSPDYGSRNGANKHRAIGEMTTPVSFRERSRRLREMENERNQLIEDLIYQVEMHEKLLEQARIDLSLQLHHSHEGQIRETKLQDQLRQVKDLMDRDPFLMVLIDGDSTIFKSELVQKGENGGREAADNLWTAANDFAQEALPHLTSPKVVAKIYVNAKSMADTLFKNSLIDNVSLFEDFMRGFNSRAFQFDFVDTGSLKQTVTEKISDTFKMSLYNCHCHQIVLGCSNNDVYTKILEDATKDPQILDHVTLLESSPFENDLARLKRHFRTTKVDNVFRSTRLRPSSLQCKGPLFSVSAGLPALTRVESNGTTSTSSTPALTWASMTAAPFVPSATTKAFTPTRSPDPAAASVVGVKKSAPGIDRNRLGQRIDKMDSTVPREEIQRIKKLKLCNIFFLQGSDACTNSNCSHDHSYKLSRNEKRVLAEVARMTPCYYQTDCDDPDCIYGHRCPQNKTGEKECWYKEDCRFWGWGHGIDTRIVKTTRI